MINMIMTVVAYIFMAIGDLFCLALFGPADCHIVGT